MLNLKRSAVLGCLIVYSTLFSNAQEKKLKFTLGAGTAYNTFRSNGSGVMDGYDFGGDFGWGWSYYAEGLVDVKLQNSTSFRSGLRYIGKGARTKEFVSGDYTSKAKDVKITMLEIPFDLVINLKVKDRDFNLVGGIFGGYMVSGMKKYQLSGSYDSPYNPNAPYHDLYKRMELGANFKAEYEFIRNVNIGAGYELGLTNLIKPSSSGTRRTSTLTFGLGYLF